MADPICELETCTADHGVQVLFSGDGYKISRDGRRCRIDLWKEGSHVAVPFTSSDGSPVFGYAVHLAADEADRKGLTHQFAAMIADIWASAI